MPYTPLPLYFNPKSRHAAGLLLNLPTWQYMGRFASTNDLTHTVGHTHRPYGRAVKMGSGSGNAWVWQDGFGWMLNLNGAQGGIGLTQATWWDRPLPHPYDSEMTLTCWAVIEGGGEAGVGRLFQHVDGYFTVYIASSGTSCTVDDNRWNTDGGTWNITGLSLNTLYHLAFVMRNDTSAPTIYVNGVSQSVNTVTTPVGTLTYGGYGSWTLGNNQIDSPVRTLDGSIGELRVYGRALSQAEVLDQYNFATRWDLYTKPRKYWKMGHIEASTDALIPRIVQPRTSSQPIRQLRI